jgi:hypothetical protein
MFRFFLFNFNLLIAGGYQKIIKRNPVVSKPFATIWWYYKISF